MTAPKPVPDAMLFRIEEGLHSEDGEFWADGMACRSADLARELRAWRTEFRALLAHDHREDWDLTALCALLPERVSEDRSERDAETHERMGWGRPEPLPGASEGA